MFDGFTLNKLSTEITNAIKILAFEMKQHTLKVSYTCIIKAIPLLGTNVMQKNGAYKYGAEIHMTDYKQDGHD